MTNDNFPAHIRVADGAGTLLRWSYTTDDVGNVTGIDTVPCEGVELALSNESVGVLRSYEHCDTVRAGPAFDVAAPGGDVYFRAGNHIALQSGFSVASGASFSAGIDPSLQSGQPISRLFEYQDYQYFFDRCRWALGNSGLDLRLDRQSSDVSRGTWLRPMSTTTGRMAPEILLGSRA